MDTRRTATMDLSMADGEWNTNAMSSFSLNDFKNFDIKFRL